MIYRTKRMTIPEYKEKKEIYELLGYKEVSYKEKGIYAIVKMSLDKKTKHYIELRMLERQVYRKGPPFFPIILFVVASFLCLSAFVISLSIALKDKVPFNLNANAIGWLLPSFAFLAACVIYTGFYFSINKSILEKGKLTKEEVKEIATKIISK